MLAASRPTTPSIRSSSQIWHAAGFVSGEPAAARLEKLEAMIARSGLDAKDIAPFLAALLSIPAEGRYPSLEMAPSEQKERTIAALIALFVGLTKDAPVLALLEDAHWIDPTSLDVFGRLVDRLPNLPALVVITFRPEFVAPWVGRAQVASLSLNRLGRRQLLTMVDRIVGGKAMPGEVLEQIVAKTDGVPLFVEELTKSVLESGLLREENGAYILALALTPLAIPSTLQRLVDGAARSARAGQGDRADRSGDRTGILLSPIGGRLADPRTGAAQRPRTTHDSRTDPRTRRAAGSDLCLQTCVGAGHGLRFAVAQPSSAHPRRHCAGIGGAFHRPDRSPRRPSSHTISQRLVLASRRGAYWLKAAELALSRSAPLEAGRYADAGLALILRLMDGPDRQSLELALQIARANALTPLKGFAAPETVAALTEAKRLLDVGIGADLQRFFVLYGLCAANYIAGRMVPVLALARQVVEVADRQDDPIYRLVGYRLLGTSQLHTGQNREALESLQLAERYRDPSRERMLGYRFGYDPGLAVLCGEVFALTFLGQIGQAAQFSEQVRAELQSHSHAPTVAAMQLPRGRVARVAIGRF